MKTHLSLFSGIGGLDLAAEMAGFTTVGQCEWADYPTKVLEKHWPDVPRWRDIRTLTGKDFYERTGLRTVEVISGGFPCQPFSVAGKRRGAEDDRFLWPEMLRVVREIKPTFVIGENVAGIATMALDQVLSDLEAEGYETQAFVFPACGVNAPHRRDRVCIVANSGHVLRLDIQEPRNDGQTSEYDKERPEGSVKLAGSGGGQGRIADVAYAEITELAWRRRATRGRRAELGRSSWWAAEPNVGRVANGVSARVDRLKCLGNAVVPAQFYPVFQAIADIMDQEEI